MKAMTLQSRLSQSSSGKKPCFTARPASAAASTALSDGSIPKASNPAAAASLTSQPKEQPTSRSGPVIPARALGGER